MGLCVAVLVNLPWEVGQAALGLFAGVSGRKALLCVVCSLGDGVIVALIYVAGWLAFGVRSGFESPGLAEYVLMTVIGLSVAIAVEWSALAKGPWQYSGRMPLLPGISVGLTPVLRMLILPPAIFYLVATLHPA